jgi:hypothetical protein
MIPPAPSGGIEAPVEIVNPPLGSAGTVEPSGRMNLPSLYVMCRVYPGGRAAGMGTGGTGDAACVDPRLAGGTGWDGGSRDETQPDRTMPISTIVGTRIKFLRSVSIGLRAKDSGVDPDLKQKMTCYHFAVTAFHLAACDAITLAISFRMTRAVPTPTPGRASGLPSISLQIAEVVDTPPFEVLPFSERESQSQDMARGDPVLCSV